MRKSVFSSRAHSGLGGAAAQSRGGSTEPCIRIALALGGGGFVRRARRLNASVPGTLLGVLTLSSSFTLGLQLYTTRKRDSLLRVDARALVRLCVVDAHHLRQVSRALTLKASCIIDASLLHRRHVDADL